MQKEILCRFSRLDSAQVHYFVSRGIIRPQRKRGRYYDYSPKNLVEFLIVRELLDYAMGPRKIAEILSAFRSMERYWWNRKEDRPASKHLFMVIYKPIWKSWKIELKGGLRSPVDFSHFKGALVINLGLLMERAKMFLFWQNENELPTGFPTVARKIQ
jgi:hypothetical protein